MKQPKKKLKEGSNIERFMAYLEDLKEHALKNDEDKSKEGKKGNMIEMLQSAMEPIKDILF